MNALCWKRCVLGGEGVSMVEMYEDGPVVYGPDGRQITAPAIVQSFAAQAAAKRNLVRCDQQPGTETLNCE